MTWSHMENGSSHATSPTASISIIWHDRKCLFFWEHVRRTKHLEQTIWQAEKLTNLECWNIKEQCYLICSDCSKQKYNFEIFFWKFIIFTSFGNFAPRIFKKISKHYYFLWFTNKFHLKSNVNFKSYIILE